MRYWIWWNDLTQGPFEIEELTSLKAFSEELMVCMEDRQEWIPAGRVADLSSAIEQMRARRMAPKTPPPPPPRRAPSMTPLQGEFFAEAPGQEHLPNVDNPDAPKGPYAYLPVSIESGDPLAPYFSGIGTSPFHFVQQPRVSPQSFIEMPRPSSNTAVLEPPRITRQSPLPKPEPEPIAKPNPIPLNIVETVAPEPVIPVAAEVEHVPSVAPEIEYDIPSASVPASRWLTWFLGTTFVIAALSAFAFWYTDRASTRSAIQEAREVPPVEVLPPLPVRDIPRRIEPAVKKIAPAVKRKLKAVAKVVKPVKKTTPIVLAPVPDPEPPALPGVSEYFEAPKPVQNDAWADRQNDAINAVMNKSIAGSKVTVKTQAKAMLDGMHEKELIHAAQTGERLFLPDKISWSALREEGSRYRVYLNFLAWRASGERVQTRSYQFVVDLKAKTVVADDPSTQQDFMKPSADLSLKHNPMAVDIESILGGVDFYNKQKMRSMIVKKSRKNSEEQKNILNAQNVAKEKLTRAVVFFRKAYTDQALQNVAKAYQFSELLKD